MFVWGAALSTVTTAIFWFVDPDAEELQRLKNEAATALHTDATLDEEEVASSRRLYPWYRAPLGARCCDDFCFSEVLRAATSPFTDDQLKLKQQKQQQKQQQQQQVQQQVQGRRLKEVEVAATVSRETEPLLGCSGV